MYLYIKYVLNNKRRTIMKKLISIALVIMMTLATAFADINLRKNKGVVEFYDTDTELRVDYDINQTAEWMEIYFDLLNKWKEINSAAIAQLNNWENLKVKVQNFSKAEYRLALANCEDSKDAYDMIKAARNNTSCKVIKDVKARKAESEKEIKRIQKQLVLAHDYCEANF